MILKKDEVTTGHGNSVIPVLHAVLLYIKIAKVKVYVKVYVDTNTDQIGGIIGKDIIKSMNMNILTKEGLVLVTCQDKTFTVSLYVDKKNRYFTS